MALFGEKYGDQVRVVSVGDWARELCGGTHAGSSGQLGVVKLLGESSIGSGVRRVEALVGADAYRFLAREHVLVAQLTEALKARPEELPERVNDIVERLRAAEKEIEKVRVRPAAGRGPASWRPAPRTSAASRSSATGADGAGGGDVRTLALDVRGRLPAGPARGRSSSSATADGKVVGRRRGQRRGPRPAGVERQRRWSARSARCSAARAAARTTSPRAAAPTPPASTRRWRSWSSARSARDGTVEHGLTANRRRRGVTASAGRRPR